MDIHRIKPDNSKPQNGRHPGLWELCVARGPAWHLRDLTPHREPTDSHSLLTQPTQQTTAQAHNPLAFPAHHLYNPHR